MAAWEVPVVRVADFAGELRERCRRQPGRIGFPESDDARMLTVADRMLAEGSARTVTLFSKKAPTLQTAKAAGLDLERHGSRLEWAAQELGPELKPILAAAAERLAQGALDAVLAGNTATTADVIRAGIAGVGLAAGVRTVSGAFLMSRPNDATYLFADCGVVIAPTGRQLVDIAAESVKTWRNLFPAEPPVVAFLSYSTKGSAAHETAQRIAEAARHFGEQHPDVISDGEMQFDAAFDAAIGSRKAPGSAVPGRANCFVFPDLGAGNIAYKIAQRLGGFEAYGPILQGLAKPYSDLSRGSTVNDILASAYVNLLRGGIS